jgi:uncharacterized protein YgbK (DUF1537 family)
VNTKIIVIDDDPTGSQTVHGCLLLTQWDVDTLLAGLQDASPLFFILSNTRGLRADKAASVTRGICENLRTALRILESQGHAPAPLLVSRSDSTLRGHYPLETDVIADTLGPFDAHFLVPAFIEGGRFTRGSVHYLMHEGKPVPVHETEFARDSVFGYHNSYLPAYVEEKTRGRIAASKVQRLLLEDVRGDALPRLMLLQDNTCCVVDAETQADLNRFAGQLLQAASRSKRFLFRSAASLLTALARLPPQPVPAEAMSVFVRGSRPGAIIVGSHVKKTTHQLEWLLQQHGVAALEIDVGRLPGERSALVNAAIAAARSLHQQGLTPVIFTSRAERRFNSEAERLDFGEMVSGTLMDIVKGLPDSIGFLVSKGGITSNDVLAKGLALRAGRVLGQIAPGCSMLTCPHDHPRFPDLPVVIFPGNVGEDQTLAGVYRTLSGCEDTDTVRSVPCQSAHS